MNVAPNCIIAYTAEDDRYAQVRVAAEEQARESGATLILYDIDAASPFSSPLPTAWDAEGDTELFPDRLAPEDLERAGRHEIAAQVRDARQVGVEAYGWLPSKKGADGVAEYADQQNCDLIMVPADLEGPGVLDRLRKATLGELVKDTSRPVAVVEEDGSIQLH
jgi:hypothetical protein